MQGGSEVTLSAHATLTSTTTKQVWARPPIDVDFQVLMFTASGLIVRFLKVFEKSSYQSVKWVRYLTKASGSYQVRVSGFVVPLKNKGEIVLINLFWRSSEAYVHACISPAISLDIYQLFRAPLARASGKPYMIPSNPICPHRCRMVAECTDAAGHKNRTSWPDEYNYKRLYDKAYDVAVKATDYQCNIHTYR